MTDAGNLLSFAGCDYLGLSDAETIRAALVAAVGRYGISAGASLATTGRSPAHAELERAWAAFSGVEAAAILPDAFLANLAVAESFPPRTTLLVDEVCHPSILRAARATDLPVEVFAHCDARSARDRAKAAPSDGTLALLTDGVFTPSGRRAPLADYLALLPASATLVVDDCHGVGVLGATGRGSFEEQGLADRRLVLVGTLAKAFGCYGGTVGGTEERVALVRERSMAYVATTALPPALASAAREALRVCDAEPERLESLWRNTLRLRRGFEDLGFSFREEPFPVFSLPVDPVSRGRDVEQALRDEGIRIPFLSYPGAPSGGCLRATVSAAHTSLEVESLLEALARVLERLGVRPAPAEDDECKEEG